MVPVPQLTSFRMQAGSSSPGLTVSLRLDPTYASNATAKCSPLSLQSEKLGCPCRTLSARHQRTHLVAGDLPRAALLRFHTPGRNNSNRNSTRPGRGNGGGISDMIASLGGQSSSPFSSSYGASDARSIFFAAGTEEAAASPDDSLQPEDTTNPSSPGQSSRVLFSFTEKPAPAGAAESSGRDGEGRGVEKTTTVVQADGEETGRGSEPLVITEEEYKLTEKGTLRTVKVTRGGSSHRTDTKVSRLLAEVGIQAELLQKKMQSFSVRKFIQEWGKKEPGLEDLKFNAAMYAPKEGVSNITQWTATELTLQRAQLVRISRDTSLLVWAFSFFGAVRILEAVVSVFATSPPNFKRIMGAMNAMDPLTVASLAHGLRKPIVGMLDVDPTNLEEVSSLKVKFWSELHKFYERQWKVIATLGVARLFTLIVTHLPSAEWLTSKVKVIWDITMALPIF